MYKVIEAIVNLVEVKHFTISDIYFTLNTEFTTALLLLFSVLSIAMNLLHTSIDCYSDMTGNVTKAIMDNFCWSIGTYICKNQTSQCFNPSDENRVYQDYYQWVSVIFFGQAAILYVPTYLWNLSEGGLMHCLCDDLGMTEIR